CNFLKSFSERISFLPSMRLHVTDNHFSPGLKLPQSRFQHRVSLAHTGAHTEENLELTAAVLLFLLSDRGEQQVGISLGLVGHRSHPVVFLILVVAAWHCERQIHVGRRNQGWTRCAGEDLSYD